MNAGDVGAVNGEILGYFKLIGTLCGVLLLAYVLLRFWLPTLAGVRATTSGPISVVSRVTLEPRKTLYVVRAGSDYVLLAASDAGVQFLSTLDSGAVEAALNESVANAESKLAFASVLRPRRRSRSPSREV
jgi:flagellar biogenesis protein FliO